MKTREEFFKENSDLTPWQLLNKTWDYVDKKDVRLLPAIIYTRRFVQYPLSGNAVAYCTPGSFEYELKIENTREFKFYLLKHGYDAYKLNEIVLICNSLELTKQLIGTGQFPDRNYFYPEHDFSVLKFK